MVDYIIDDQVSLKCRNWAIFTSQFSKAQSYKSSEPVGKKNWHLALVDEKARLEIGLTDHTGRNTLISVCHYQLSHKSSQLLLITNKQELVCEQRPDDFEKT